MLLYGSFTKFSYVFDSTCQLEFTLAILNGQWIDSPKDDMDYLGTDQTRSLFCHAKRQLIEILHLNTKHSNHVIIQLKANI